MKIKFLLFLFLYIVISLNIKAQDEHPIDKELTACMEKYPSTYGMIACIDTAYGKWDKEMNNYYQKLLNELDDNSDNKLKDAQRKWIEYRDLEFRSIAGIYSGKEGTMYLPMQVLDKMEIVKKRALELKGYYEMLTEY